MLRVEDLHVEVDGKSVLRGVNLKVNDGEVVYLLGPNGSGKSSLIQTIMGNPKYKVVSGSIHFNEVDLLKLDPHERAARGIGAVYQIPPKLKGVKLRELLRRLTQMYGTSMEEIEDLAKKMGADKLLDRDLHVGFSGGEMKRAEILLVYAQRPKLILLDEPDSGVDVVGLPVIGEAIRELLEDGERSALVVTHTGQIARYLPGSLAYIMIRGKIICCGELQNVLSDIEQGGFEACMNCIVSELMNYDGTA